MQLVDGQAPQQCQERHEESLSSFQGDIVSDREGEGSVRKSTPGAHSPSDPQAFGGGGAPSIWVQDRSGCSITTVPPPLATVIASRKADTSREEL